MCACMSLCHRVRAGTCGGQKRVSDLLKGITDGYELLVELNPGPLPEH